MNTEEWIQFRDSLSRINEQFILAYPRYANGKNKKVRADAEQIVDDSINAAINLMQRYEEAYILLTGGNESTDYNRALILDEYRQPRYFGRDTRAFLQTLNEYISNMEE